MEGFIQFVKILFLAKSILLTPAPIDLDEHWMEIKLKKPLVAITVGAAVEIQFGEGHEYFKGSENIGTTSEMADEFLPDGTFSAELTDTQGSIMILNKRNILLTNHHAIYAITGDSPFPVGVEYTKLRIKSSKPTHGVEIYWKNYRL